MMELMATVIIISVCLVMALRIFSMCASYVSEAISNSGAAEILKDKLNALYEKSVFQNGIDVSSSSESISRGKSSFSYAQETGFWNELVLEDEETQGAEAAPAETEEEEETSGLCEVTSQVRWKTAGRSRGINVKTLLPIKGFRYEF